jgi:hypothetical protein
METHVLLGPGAEKRRPEKTTSNQYHGSSIFAERSVATEADFRDLVFATHISLLVWSSSVSVVIGFHAHNTQSVWRSVAKTSADFLFKLTICRGVDKFHAQTRSQYTVSTQT